MATKALTLRLPPPLYESSHQIAQERHISLNALIQESLQATVRAEQQRRLYADFTALGEDTEGSTVEYAIAAQHEVVSSDPVVPENYP